MPSHSQSINFRYKKDPPAKFVLEELHKPHERSLKTSGCKASSVRSQYLRDYINQNLFADISTMYSIVSWIGILMVAFRALFDHLLKLNVIGRHIAGESICSI